MILRLEPFLCTRIGLELQKDLTIKAAAFLCEGDELAEGFGRGGVHEHSRVEAVGPADIGGCRKLLAFEQLVAVLDNLVNKLVLGFHVIKEDER